MQQYAQEVTLNNISSDEESNDYILPRLQRQNAFSNNSDEQPSPNISDISTNVYNESSCPICYQDETGSTPLKCGHVFCNLCIQTLIKHTNILTCPLCRAIQQVDSVQELQTLRQSQE